MLEGYVTVVSKEDKGEFEDENISLIYRRNKSGPNIDPYKLK